MRRALRGESSVHAAVLPVGLACSKHSGIGEDFFTFDS